MLHFSGPGSHWISVWSTFISTWRNLLDIFMEQAQCYWPLSALFMWQCFISPSALEGNFFSDKKFLVENCFFSQHFKYVILLSSHLQGSYEKLVVNLIGDLLYVMGWFSLKFLYMASSFQDSLFPFVFFSLMIMCLSVSIFDVSSLEFMELHIFVCSCLSLYLVNFWPLFLQIFFLSLSLLHLGLP